ncbi:Reversal of tor2 lethality [Yamadazyma tenuis]|uniref:Protein ROT1 n=1 Tax=Candida tenuis (strain ATCC 10573 / BCRC 21748 / CBS 615 / JCM 9827 / NBRC 10315 / NRRL Y-1498 / VKM Y-70) TaxID=590646 RepID=G3AY43_CANTC|nr:uncharacterized protein CANTEDRAFT_112630 [Yamadazyma tenuis ATCC 10573]EGV65765.1 hypothetical protein CANTEDRAFT_112630 [Yamadazyma tenuis ATCC 10573]WEJ95915.1 Reversal of tor2 lethality [Yamadazyma tenuis]
MLFKSSITSTLTLLTFWSPVSFVAADPNNAELVGTWTSKSNTVFTGPGFYDPVDELLIEPDLPGISYSFTEDGHYEEALYRLTSDAVNHSCAIASLTYQHGTYEILANGSVSLTPLAVDGRQLLSDPCGSSGVSNPDYETTSFYSRYVQSTLFKTYQVSVDAYHGRYKLQIYQFDGSLMQPLYLAYKPPLMLPTYALNPTDKASETKDSLRKRVRRSLENQYRTTAIKEFNPGKYDLYWYMSATLLGGAAVFAFFH